MSHLWMSNLGDGIMKFRSQAEQAQLHGAHMQTFIIEQQAFIIHTGGFSCSPQINYEPALHTLTHWCWNADGDEYLVAHRLCWQEPCLVIYSLKKSTLKRCDKMHCGLLSSSSERRIWVLVSSIEKLDSCQGWFWRHWFTVTECLEEESQPVQSVCAYFILKFSVSKLQQQD